MTNTTVIGKAAGEVIKWQTSHNLRVYSWDEAWEAVQDWYNYTDITSPYLLSACVLSFGAKYKPVSHSEILDAARNFEN